MKDLDIRQRDKSALREGYSPAVRRFELGSIAALADNTWNNPALADGKAFLRNSEEMACFDLARPRNE